MAATRNKKTLRHKVPETEAELDAMLWQLLGAGCHTIFCRYYYKLMRLRDASRSLDSRPYWPNDSNINP